MSSAARGNCLSGMFVHYDSTEFSTSSHAVQFTLSGYLHVGCYMGGVVDGVLRTCVTVSIFPNTTTVASTSWGEQLRIRRHWAM